MAKKKKTQRTVFNKWANRLSASMSLLTIAAIVSTPLWAPDHDKTGQTAPEPELSVTVDDIPATPPMQITVTPPPTDIDTNDEKYNLSDYADSIPEDKREFFDLSLQIAEITSIDAYIIFAKLAMETRFDRDFVNRANHGIKGARGLFQQELANIVTGVRVHGDDLTTVNSLPKDNDLRLAVANHGRTEHLKQMPFYKTLDTNDPLKISIDKGWRDSNEDGVNDLDLSKSNGYAALPKLEQQMIASWSKHMRIADGLLVQYIAKQAKSGNFETAFDKAIYGIPHNDLISGELAARDVLHTTPSAHKDNFTKTWAQDLEMRNTAFLAAYSTHNMGKNGARIQMAIAANPDWALVKPRHTEHMNGIINEVSSALGIRAISPETLSLRANRNQAVFQEGSATRYGCLSYNISSEVNTHVGSFVPVMVDYGDQKQWYEGNCGRDPLASHRPKIRPVQQTIATSAAPEKSPRPKMRPTSFKLAQN